MGMAALFSADGPVGWWVGSWRLSAPQISPASLERAIPYPRLVHRSSPPCSPPCVAGAGPGCPGRPDVHSRRENPMTAGTRGAPLRGRGDELAAIGARLDEVRSGVGSVIIVEGRAGLGKTRLLDACASMAAERSFRVGRGVTEPQRRAVELDVLFDALFGGEKPLLARNALSDLHASPEQRFWLLQDLQAVIEKAALRDPLL